MEFKSEVSILKPFSPSILFTKLPQVIVDDFNKDCSDIANNKKKKTDWSGELAGRTKEEYLISDDVLIKYKNFFIQLMARLIFPEEQEYKDNVLGNKFTMGIFSGWYVRSYDGDFNPKHHHTGCQMSCVGFLKLPEDMEEIWKEEDKDHSPFAGYLQFYHGNMGLTCNNNIKVKPRVGDFYLFPASLEHQVYPFRSKFKNYEPQGERRSFSINLVYSNNELTENITKSINRLEEK